MRALVYQGPWRIAVQERADPVMLRGHALVRVIATGICGSDLHGYTGENGRRSPGQVMGHETVLEVIDVDDSGGTAITPGSLVTLNPVIGCAQCDACLQGETQRCLTKRVIGVEPTIDAAMAQTMVVPIANLVRLPTDLSPDLGALVEPLAVGYHAVRRAGVSASSLVLVVGAGPIGQAVALAARRAGADRVVVSEPDPGRRALVASLGFSVCDPTAENFAGNIEHILSRPPNVVLDGVGNASSMRTALTVSSPQATVVLVGMEEPQLTIDAYRVSTEERALLGSFCYSEPEFNATAEWLAEQGDSLLPLIDHRVHLDDAPEAFHALADGTLKASKVLIYPNGFNPASPSDDQQMQGFR